MIGSRANSPYKSIGIKCIKLHFSCKIYLQHNTTQLQQLMQLVLNFSPLSLIVISSLLPIPISLSLWQSLTLVHTPSSYLLQTFTETRILVKPFSTPMLSIYIWSQSSLAMKRKKYFGLSCSSKEVRQPSGLRTSLDTKQILANSLSRPGLTSNNNFRLSSFQLMQKPI